MNQTTRKAALAPRTFKHIRRTAKRVAASHRIFGMDADDVAQELFLDLWRRCPAFDPGRSSFPTFADRIIAHRVASMMAPTLRIRIEWQQVRLDDQVEGLDGCTLGDILPDPAALGDLDYGLALDLRRFLDGLSPALQRCCVILAEPNVRSAAAQANTHHSSIYERARRVRKLAENAGLRVYLNGPRQNADGVGR